MTKFLVIEKVFSVTPRFRIGFPEAAGLAILGSTIGALLGGAASGQLNLYGALGAVAGGAAPFAVVLLMRSSGGA